MTSLPQGPTATQLHQRALTEEEEPRTAHKTAAVPTPSGPPPGDGSSSSANTCEHVWRFNGVLNAVRNYSCIHCHASKGVLD